VKPISRRDLLYHSATGLGVALLAPFSRAATKPLQCTPAPLFPVPLTAGLWRSAPFPVGKHSYRIHLQFDRRPPLEQLDCDLGPVHTKAHCNAPPLLDVAWGIWDRDLPVKGFVVNPIGADAWAATETSCILGGFEGRRNGMFTLEWNVKKDAGRLKDLHPRILIAKDPGYWCWL